MADLSELGLAIAHDSDDKEQRWVAKCMYPFLDYASERVDTLNDA